MKTNNDKKNNTRQLKKHNTAKSKQTFSIFILSKNSLARL